MCFVVVIHWLIFPYPSGLLHWHCGNLTIAPVPAKQPWWIWINTSCEFIMNDCITTTKQSTTKPCAYFLGYAVHREVRNSNLCGGVGLGDELNIMPIGTFGLLKTCAQWCLATPSITKLSNGLDDFFTWVYDKCCFMIIPRENATVHHWWYVISGSGNGLGPSGKNVLPEPMFTLIYVVIWRHWATMR